MNRLSIFFRPHLATLFCIVTSLTFLLAGRDVSAQTSLDSSWQIRSEARLKSIYDCGEFRARNFRPTCLSDSSGFVTEEIDPDTKQATQWFHEASSGERQAWKPDGKLLNADLRLSPKGTHQLISRDWKLLSVELENRNKTLLASSPPGREVEYRNPVWSPDGSRVVFIEADFTDVRQRSVLVPTDPSYPEVENRRFARVGGQIEKLRIGVVNSDGQQLTWLLIECPEDGIYLGQVDWAGNSEEVLVEKFSRFRDKRDFLLVSTNGQIKTIYSEENEAWVESSQGKNSGLVWIAGGLAFVVISEKDGWRHAYRSSRDGNRSSLLDLVKRIPTFRSSKGWWTGSSRWENRLTTWSIPIGITACVRAMARWCM